MGTTLAAMGNTSSKYLTMFGVAPGKVGKTTFFAASALGALPHQKFGLVDKPENLHILGFDDSFADGLVNFLVKSCGKSEKYLNVDVENLTDAARKMFTNNGGWDYGLYNLVKQKLDGIKQKVAKGGVHAVLFSSLSGLAKGLKAGLAGAPDPGKKGSGMDQSKWDALSHQLNAIRNYAQEDSMHVFWEGHIVKSSGKDEDAQKDTNGIQGEAGKAWGHNVGCVVLLRREAAKYEGTKVDKVYMDTRPSLDFVSGGRGFNEALDPKEYDLALMAEKLGKKVGKYTGE